MLAAFKNSTKAMALGVLGLFLCSSTYVLGAAPLLILRNNFGRLYFLIISLFFIIVPLLIGQGLLSSLFFTSVLLVFIYSELEEHGTTYAASVLISVLFVSGFSVVGTAAYVHLTKVNIMSVLQTKANEIAASITQINPKVTMTADNIISQLPSGIVVSFIITLALGILIERLVRNILLSRGHSTSPSYYSLLSLELPDICVWITILGIAAVGIKMENPIYKTVGINILNVMMTLYFFQGLAVFYSFFRTFKIGVIWQAVWALIFVFQLFIFVAAVGFVDYWLDIRKRIYRRVAPSNLDKRV